MIFRVEVDVMPLKELLDPQGKAVAAGLHKLNYAGVQDVRVGKHFTIKIDAASEQDATTQVEAACKQMLANQIMEGYSFKVFAE
jgi:phosphoribosylformylglycinamidine synthase PurS subunit